MVCCCVTFAFFFSAMVWFAISQAMFWVRTKMPISVGSAFYCILVIYDFQLHCGFFTFSFTVRFIRRAISSCTKFLFPYTYTHKHMLSIYVSRTILHIGQVLHTTIMLPQNHYSMPHRMTVECGTCMCWLLLLIANLLFINARISSRNMFGLMNAFCPLKVTL